MNPVWYLLIILGELLNEHQARQAKAQYAVPAGPPCVQGCT